MLDVNNFEQLRIGLATADSIRTWSNGEVKKPETINYRTLRPEKDGLFCEKIFGPTKDWECYCGKYKRVRFRGIICERCGVEVTRSKVRRERMGHIELAAPVVHIWYLRGTRSWLAYLLMGTEAREELKAKQLEKVIYFAANLVTWVNEEKRHLEIPNAEAELAEELTEIERARDLDLDRRFKALEDELAKMESDGAKDSEIKARQRQVDKELTAIRERAEAELDLVKRTFDEFRNLHSRKIIEDELLWRELKDRYGDFFRGGMGAEAIASLISEIDFDEEEIKLRDAIDPSDGRRPLSVQRRQKAIKRLKIVSAFNRRDEHGRRANAPRAMILDAVPVIPPELRPMVQLDGGRFATSDLNDLYRRVINRNNRLKKLMELHAPDVIVRNEKRMLQEAVDALFDNGRRGRVLRGTNNRPLKSLSDTLKGKQGRFRQNLLGKRVDYSGRSVIVVGPELKLHQCGLPKKMALELFKPFIYHKLEAAGHCTTIKQAKELVEAQEPVVWDILEDVIREHPVLLNRAPTLHRLGIQAFEPVLVEGKAIRIHPLVCTAFNADFDGDQMAVHIPLSPEAQVEASVLMLASHNILKPSDGKPVTMPTQDMVLGLYYLTKARPGTKGEGRMFASIDEVLIALEMGEVETLTPIRLRYTGELIDLTTAYDDQDIIHTEPIHVDRAFVHTTVGRVIFNDHLPTDMPFVNGLLKKKGIQALVQYCYLRFGLEKTVVALDKLKELGFLYATKSGVSIGISDMVIPNVKFKLVDAAEHEVVKVQQQYLDGAITNGERYNKVIAIWSDVTEKVADEMFKALERQDKEGVINPVYVMADSGARGSKQQIRQLSGMRGLMAKPSGEIIETPITANFREGLTVLEYFISTHGARKGLADTALKTADSGYLTRRLVDVAQDVIISEYDCGTVDGIYVTSIVESGEIIEPLRDRIVGRVSLEKIKDYEGNIIVDINQEITEDLAGAIQAAGIERVKIRSVLTCESKRGVCVMCYGRNLASGRLVELGEATGVIAAQSIGEPGTQLTMRTFHIGGTASRVSEQSRLDAKSNGTVRFINLQTVKSKTGDLVVMNRQGSIAVVDEKGRERERYAVVYGAKVKVAEGGPVALREALVEWDPYTFAILTEIGGTAQFKDLQEGITLHEEVDVVTGLSRHVVADAPH